MASAKKSSKKQRSRGNVKKRLSLEALRKAKVPPLFFAGLILASALGWAGWTALTRAPHYYQSKALFPTKATADLITDGDTFQLANGLPVRLLGIDAPARGKAGHQEAKDELAKLVLNKQLILEYDTYQDDKFGRILAYVWVACTPDLRQFCRKEHSNRALVNEVLVKRRLAVPVSYTHRKPLKYAPYLKP